MRYSGYLGILLCNTFRSINNKNCNISSFNCCNSSYDTETLQIFFNLALTA